MSGRAKGTIELVPDWHNRNTITGEKIFKPKYHPANHRFLDQSKMMDENIYKQLTNNQ